MFLILALLSFRFLFSSFTICWWFQRWSTPLNVNHSSIVNLYLLFSPSLLCNDGNWLYDVFVQLRSILFDLEACYERCLSLLNTFCFDDTRIRRNFRIQKWLPVSFAIRAESLLEPLVQVVLDIKRNNNDFGNIPSYFRYYLLSRKRWTCLYPL